MADSKQQITRVDPETFFFAPGAECVNSNMTLEGKRMCLAIRVTETRKFRCEG